MTFQCPCVIKPGTNKCIAYDSRYQAASIDEALVAFRDVTMDDDTLTYPSGGIIVGLHIFYYIGARIIAFLAFLYFIFILDQ